MNLMVLMETAMISILGMCWGLLVGCYLVDGNRQNTIKVYSLLKKIWKPLKML